MYNFTNYSKETRKTLIVLIHMIFKFLLTDQLCVSCTLKYNCSKIILNVSNFIMYTHYKLKLYLYLE